MLRNLLLGTAMVCAMAGTALAVPVGSFSADGKGAYMNNSNGAVVASAATRLDFGIGSGTGGNGFGVMGMININAGTGSFSGYTGAQASIADLQFAGTAGSGTSVSSVSPSGAFITFSSPTLALTILSSTVIAVGDNLIISGTASYTDSSGTSNGSFNLSTSPQDGVAGATNFSFTTNASAVAPVPEPMSLALLGTGLVGLGVFARRRRS